jgi:hypothetical protein
VKIALAILFAFVLAMGQPMAEVVASPELKPCCGCGGSKCCVGKSDASEDTPAVPVANSAQKDLQILNLPPAFALTAFVFSSDESAHFSFQLPITRSVPLFTRDCAYLL